MRQRVLPSLTAQATPPSPSCPGWAHSLLEARLGRGYRAGPRSTPCPTHIRTGLSTNAERPVKLAPVRAVRHIVRMRCNRLLQKVSILAVTAALRLGRTG